MSAAGVNIQPMHSLKAIVENAILNPDSTQNSLHSLNSLQQQLLNSNTSSSTGFVNTNTSTTPDLTIANLLASLQHHHQQQGLADNTSDSAAAVLTAILSQQKGKLLQ